MANGGSTSRTVLCETLHEQLEVTGLPFTMSTLEGLATQACHRPGSLRYRDGPEIKSMIRQRKHLKGAEAKAMAQRIVTARCSAKRAWMTSLLERGASGDFQAVLFFKRRQTTKCTQGSYIMRSGSQEKAQPLICVVSTLPSILP